ncbi:hypothetical protein MF628_000886 [Paenibacillus polymyxa]|uniref:hypothetical protein n=1 Tax=Paenibacillus polymyxa TaxID=1406 RepID=UPI00202507EF|nr:hypothetical protein [Paenibacillus polymyxa]URJ46359.1 hypothetical protein MF628_000886 [Paenibacillus polymyxa]
MEELERFLEIHRKNIQDRLENEKRLHGENPELKQIVVSLYICDVLKHFGLVRNNLTMEQVLGLAEIYKEYSVTE